MAIFSSKRTSFYANYLKGTWKTSEIWDFRTIMLPCTNVNTEAAARNQRPPILFVITSLVTVIVFRYSRAQTREFHSKLSIINTRFFRYHRKRQTIGPTCLRHFRFRLVHEPATLTTGDTSSPPAGDSCNFKFSDSQYSKLYSFYKQ